MAVEPQIPSLMLLRFIALASLYVLLLANAQTRAPTGSSYCNQGNFETLNIPPCQDEFPRSILFVMDGSNSLSKNDFYGPMLDYALGLYCAMHPQFPHQVGMLIFGEKIQPLITLSQYTRAQWFTQVQRIRDEASACCSCCTPTADAFDLANAHFAQYARPGNIKIAMTVTDGVPSNNNVGSDGNPLWLWTDPTKGFNPATYNYEIVPGRAAALRNSGVRLMLLAVPSENGDRPDQAYFNGGYANNRNMCLKRSLVEFCARYRLPPFPISSQPVEQNSVSAGNFNLQGLLDLTVEKVCLIPTDSPTVRPTRLPTSQAPTKSPTKRPTSKQPTKQPTTLPTSSPTFIYLDQVDLHIVMDHSRSMWWRDSFCRSLVPPGDSMPDTLEASACWNLWINFVRRLAVEISDSIAGIERNRRLAWADDYPENKNPNAVPPHKGLRISLVGFAYQNKQKTPKTFPFTYQFNNGQPMLSNLTALDQMLSQMRLLRPDGGTCPGMAIEEAVRNIETNPEATHPLQAVVLLSDGVFYDRPFPAMATKGLAAYKALRFAVGVAINDNKNNKERKAQIADMRAFAGDDSRFYDLNTDGWNVLDDVARKIAIDLPKFMIAGGKPMPRFSWCGWRRSFACLGNGEAWRANKCQWKGGKSSKAQWKCAAPKKSG